MNGSKANTHRVALYHKIARISTRKKLRRFFVKCAYFCGRKQNFLPKKPWNSHKCPFRHVLFVRRRCKIYPQICANASFCAKTCTRTDASGGRARQRSIFCKVCGTKWHLQCIVPQYNRKEWIPWQGGADLHFTKMKTARNPSKPCGIRGGTEYKTRFAAFSLRKNEQFKINNPQKNFSASPRWAHFPQQKHNI